MELGGDEGPLPLAAMQRRLLAALAIRPGEPCANDLLIEALWEANPPASAPKLVQVYVSQLRKLLPSGVAIGRRERSYLLELAEGAFDAAEFERLLREGRTAAQDGNAALAASLFARALSLWRGQAYGELAFCEFARAEADRLEELRLACVEERFDAELELGRHAELLAELQRLAATQPLRERLQQQAMLALYRCGRQVEALDLYTSAAARLREELGLEPGPQLRELQRRILQHDAELAAATSATAERSDALPAPPDSLLGRERELAELRELLLHKRARLLVLTGAGGSGKTRLALAVAHDAAPSFANGAVFVDLASLRDPDLVLAAITQKLEIPEAGHDRMATLVAALRGRELLLALDNAEHLRAAAPSYAELLAHAPHLTLLVTSRVVLHLSGEHVYPVGPLEPDAAVELFRQRAREADPSLQFDPADEEAIERICERLEGLPLAIELAAAHTRTLTPTELLARLEPRLPLLTGGPHDLPARQQTLTATLEWSYQLLDAAAQRDLRRLAVFVGGCALDAAEAVAETAPQRLATLVDHNLLRRTLSDRSSRYTMLETIREYALERLERPEEVALRDRHAAHFTAFAEQAHAARLEQSAEWLPRLEQEHANLRAALDWYAESDSQQALRLAGALGWFWAYRGHLVEGRQRMTVALAADQRASSLRVRALAMAAQLLSVQGDLVAAREWAEEATRLAPDFDDADAAAAAFFTLGIICTHQNEFARARRLHERALNYAQMLDTQAFALRALTGLCYVLVCARESGLAEATAHELLEQARTQGYRVSEQLALHYLGDCALQRDDCATAERHYRDALAAAWRLGHTNQAATELIGLAMALAGQSKSRQALRLAAAVRSHRATEDVQPSVPFWEELQDHYFERARAQLGHENAEDVWCEGQALPIDQAITEALDAADTGARPHTLGQ